MSRWDLQSVIGIVGVFGVVAGLIFVGTQIKQANDIAYAEITTWMEESRLITHQAIIDNAEVWRKGCAGGNLSADEQVIFEHLIRNEIVIMRYRHVRSKSFDPIVNAPEKVIENSVKFLGKCQKMKNEYMKHDPDFWFPVGMFPHALHDEIKRQDD